MESPSQTKMFHCKDLGVLTRKDFDQGPVSLDEIEHGLFLGNLTAATHMHTLKSFRITYILTLDSVPLPKHITEATFLTTKYIHIADMLKADILTHLDDCTQFINEALEQSKNILVHCYFGVSRSSSVVIAYIMKKHNLNYEQAYELVKSKRRFVQPNDGFVKQLKLYKCMGCKIEPTYQKYKIFRLRLAGDQFRKAKILSQNFNNLINSDPAITQENPEPIVYRCKRCRRILASKSHLLQHKNKSLYAPAVSSNAIQNGDNISIEPITSSQASSQPSGLLQQISAQIRKVSIESAMSYYVPGGNIDEREINSNSICQNIIFVEPIAWMKQILNNTQGRLLCPKCDQKVGNFSWVNSCHCPCGEEVSPAFYLIPSRVELSRTVQNVQTTI